jgi:hypothetical protein
VHASLRLVFTTTAALAAVVVIAVLVTLPPATKSTAGTLPPEFVMGAYHIHTSRSDGTGDVDAVAAAASRAGLAFIILTDHGDATRPPEPPTYRHGVLCIDAVEVNTGSGHVVALGLKEQSPFPLAGPARDVIEDIRRLGGHAVIAHPDSPNPDLRWRGPQVAADGLEWINVDSEWRDERLLTLVGTSAHALIRGPSAIASLMSRPSRTLARWDTDAIRRPTFGLAGLDVHANIPFTRAVEPRPARGLPVPSYETMFRTMAQVAVLDAPLSRNAPADAARVLQALTTGKSYTVVRAFAEAAALRFTATQGTSTITMGSRVPAGTPLALEASVSGTSDARVTLLRQGRTVAQGTSTVARQEDGRPAVFRTEVLLPGIDMPWMLSNPIVVEDIVPPSPGPALIDGEVVLLDGRASGWVVEREASSAGTVENDGPALKFSFQLGSGTPRGQYAAAVTRVPDALGVDRIEFTGRADRPMRVSLQVRMPAHLGGQRWRRSVFLDRTPRAISVPLQDFDPADAPTSRRPIVARLDAVLIVVDTLNSHTGTSGTIWLEQVSVRSRATTSEQ